MQKQDYLVQYPHYFKIASTSAGERETTSTNTWVQGKKVLCPHCLRVHEVKKNLHASGV